MIRNWIRTILATIVAVTLVVMAGPQMSGPGPMNGSGWNIYTVDSHAYAGYFTSIALDSDDNPHISYHDDYPNYDLKYAKWDGSGWNIETVDSAGEPGYYTSIALDSDDNPHISYHDYYPNRDLKYAKWDGTAWNIETVDSAGVVGGFTSIALDSDDNPHISYQHKLSGTNRDLKYAKWDGNDWNIETVDSAGVVGWYTSLALDSSDNPHISYDDETNYDLKYARWDGTAWNIETVDSAGNVGRYTSIALDSGDNPHISYLANLDLEYATKAELEQLPVAEANGPYEGEEGTPILFDASGSYDPDGNPLQHRWDFDNDGVWDTGWSNNPFAFHTWTDDYSGDVLVEVTDGLRTTTDTASVTVNNVAPTVSVGDDMTINEGDTVSFSASAFDPGDDTITYEWYFGDGTTSTEQNPQHTYTEDGTYVVTLTVSDDDGGVSAIWNTETVDSFAGTYTSLALDSDENPHIIYYDYANKDLKYAKWDGSDWDIETVDAAGKVGSFTSIALDSNDNPHISYFDETNYDLKYARWNGSEWSIETVDSAGVGQYTSIALDSNDNPHISYRDGTNRDLKYAKWDGTKWHNETVDSAGKVGYHTSIAIDSDDNPHMSYFDLTYYDLKYAKWDGSDWNIETVDSAGDVGYYTSIALDSDDNPHISYFDFTNSDLKYAKWDGSDWNIETVDSAGIVGGYTSLALDGIDNPHISYSDGTNDDLKYAKWDGSDWNIETVDSAGIVGGYTSIALDSDDNPHISYRDYANNDLKYARWTGTSLVVTVLNVDPTVSLGPDLTIDEGDTVTLSTTASDPGSLDVLTYEWDTDEDGLFDDGTGQSISWTGDDEGVYTISVKVTDDDGFSIDDVDITVNNVPPTVSLGADLTIDEGVTVVLTATASDPGLLDVLTYEWDTDEDGLFDDGTGQSISWNGDDDGAHTISVRVTDGDSGSDTDDIDITVDNVAPIADADVSQNIVDEGTPVYFYGNQIDPGADTFEYYWIFGDGDTSTDQNPTHTYMDDGVYTVTLTVTDDDLDSGTDTIYITVNSAPPMATASVDQNPVDEGVEVQFTGGVSGPSGDTYTHYWEFGDGGTSTEQSPTYTYMDNGLYAASLTVTDDDGDSDTAWIIMFVNDLGPTADAGPDKSVTIIDVVTFDGSGSSSYPDTIVSYEWDFDDGETASGMTVTHTFDEIGTYTVTLTVTDDDGSIDTDTALVKVLVPGVELIPSEVIFSPPSPVDIGVSMTISSEITNYGNTDASNVIVRFYDGDPDENDDGKPDSGAVQIGSDITFTTILSEQTVSVSVTWTSTAGYHDIYVWADPDDYVPEYDDTNNQAYDMIVVGPDLIPLNLAFSPSSPTAVGDTITISVDVTNNGGTSVSDVLVRFYEEYPDANDDGFQDPAADQIGDVTIPSLAPGETVPVSVTWSPTAVGNYELSVWVDPAVPPGGGTGAIVEAIETNNIATETMNVGPDLTIAFTDISFSDNPVAEGATVTITAVIHNDGGQEADDVVVKFYDNEIKNRNLIGTVTISTITAGSTDTISITWDATGVGYHDIWVVIDKKNDIEEYDETNNQAYNVLSVV